VTDQDGFEEAVILFDANGDGVAQELRHVDFEAMLEGSAGLDEFAASIVNAAFVVVGEALSVRGIVLFSCKVDEEGSLDPNFNLPLRYLSDNAGPGPDLGTGPIRLACRGRCPVPWHAVHLWEPDTEDGMEAAQLVQKSIWRNRLSLKPTAKIERILGDGLELNDSLDESLDAVPSPARVNHKQLEASLTETFGEEGKVNLEGLIRNNNDRLTKVTDRYRTDLEQQQQGYLDQIKNCRDEIQKLKSALRNEQQHSRRLQSLLRGDP
jgi:hypothetical protein